jgi:hypothetical protein
VLCESREFKKKEPRRIFTQMLRVFSPPLGNRVCRVVKGRGGGAILLPTFFGIV